MSECPHVLALPAQEQLRVHRIGIAVIPYPGFLRLVPIAFNQGGVEVARRGDEQTQTTRAEGGAIRQSDVVAVGRRLTQPEAIKYWRVYSRTRSGSAFQA